MAVEADPTVGTAQLTQTCNSCSTALDASLALLPGSDPGVCPLLPDAAASSLTALALRRFVCFGAGADGAAGSCVVQLVVALKSVGLLQRVRTLDPSLAFSGSLLPGLCAALFPTPPAPASCCPRSWALLMSALTQQACLPALSREYASLPGRCEAVQNRTVPGFCELSWPTDLLPLLAPPPAAVCGTGPSAGKNSSGGSGGSGGGGGPLSAWLDGSACSLAHLLLTQPPGGGGTCGLWCGLVGEMGRIATGEISGPEGSVNGNGSGSSTNGTPPPAGGGSGGSGSGGGRKLNTATIVIVCVFSVLIAALLLALAIFGWNVYQEHQTIKREAYQFDTEINNSMPPDATGPTPPGGKAAAPSPPPPATPSRACAAAAAAAPPETVTDSAPQTPVASYSVPIPTDATDAANAGGVVRTPRYQPGPPPPEAAAAAVAAAAAATAAAASSSQPRGVSNPSNTARALVFGDGDAGGGDAAAGGGGDAVSSRYESATSLFVDPSKCSTGLTRYSSMTAGGSTGNLVAVGTAAAAAGGGGGGGAGPDRLRSHRLSLTDSEATASVYQTAHSPEGFFAAGGPGNDPSGSYTTARSTYTAGSVAGAGSGVSGGGAGAGGSAAAVGAEAYPRAQSAGTAAAAAAAQGAAP